MMPIRRIYPEPDPESKPETPEDKLEDLLDRFEELLGRMERKMQVEDKDAKGDA
jgi:hypothetical protein